MKSFRPALLATALSVLFSPCLISQTFAADSVTTTVSSLTFDNSKWNYDATNNVYWQIGINYVSNPESTAYESFGIYVPGDYLSATSNGNGTYTGTLNTTNTVNGYTARTAPIVIPVNTSGYSQVAAPTAYNYSSELASYIKAGFIYVNPGLRGKQNGYDSSGNLIYSGGAPWGVTDLKAVVRYLRYNKSSLPGNDASIFIFGMSGGGAQTSIMAASGDSELYTPYLNAIGAAMTDANGASISDAVLGAMAWCPITSLDYANEAYEWNMGQYSSSGTRASDTFTSALSKELAKSFAIYINTLGLKDSSGNTLSLSTSSTGVYAAGSYYDYLIKTVEGSLNNFLEDTSFPYTPSSSSGGQGGQGGGMPTNGTIRPSGTPPTVAMGTVTSSTTTTTTTTTTTYQTVQDYIDSLNQNTQWVTYDATTNTVKIISLAGFVNSQKTPSKSVAAFDNLNRTQAENDVFGNDGNDYLHFDVILADALATNQTAYSNYADWNASYVSDYANDLKEVDKLGKSIQYRLNMYNPMYYLTSYYEGYKTSTVAPYWRIHTGIMQGDTATTVEMNLALALGNYKGVKSVEFATVWGQAHTTAERTGKSTDNFIAYVNQVLAGTSSTYSGTLANRQIEVNITPSTTDTGKTGNYYVCAIVNTATYCKTSFGWTPWQSDNIPVYRSGVLSPLSINLIDGYGNLSNLVGTEIYSGYGVSESDMLINRKYAKVYTVE